MRTKDQLIGAALAVGFCFGLTVPANAALEPGISYASPVSAAYYTEGVFNFPDVLNFGQYFETPGVGITFTTPPDFTTTISSINETADVGGANSDPLWPGAATVFGADFTTTISVAHTGTYHIGFGTDDAGYLFVDGSLIGFESGANGYPGVVPYADFLTAGTHTLEVQYDNSFCCGAVANVTLGVPEPATWAMMLVGFAGLGVAIRSRRHVIVAA